MCELQFGSRHDRAITKWWRLPNKLCDSVEFDLQVLEKLLPRLKIKTEKVVFYTHSNQVKLHIILSQHTDMYVRIYLSNRYIWLYCVQMVAALEEFLLSLKYSYITLDNKISFSARQQMMEQFRDLSSTEFILLCCAEYVTH